jgi:uncharacterized protein
MRLIYLIIPLIVFATASCKHDDKYFFNELNKIASNGNPEAQYYLGMLYNNGNGTNKDKVKAFEWFQKSSSGGDPLGSYKVGCYYSGQGEGIVVPDYNKALEYKLIAAEAGYVRAQCDVALIYYHNKDMVNAISWWEKAASQGYPDAFYALFSVYYEGKGISKNLVKAFQYLKIIERNTENNKKEEVKSKLNEIKAELSQAELDQVQIFVENWKPQQTELTLKAYAGIKESREIVEKLKGK